MRTSSQTYPPPPGRASYTSHSSIVTHRLRVPRSSFLPRSRNVHHELPGVADLWVPACAEGEKCEQWRTCVKCEMCHTCAGVGLHGAWCCLFLRPGLGPLQPMLLPCVPRHACASSNLPEAQGLLYLLYNAYAGTPTHLYPYTCSCARISHCLIPKPTVLPVHPPQRQGPLCMLLGLVQ